MSYLANGLIHQSIFGLISHQTFLFLLFLIKEILLRKNFHRTLFLLLFTVKEICLKKNQHPTFAPSSEHEIFRPGLAKSSSPRSQNTWAFQQDMNTRTSKANTSRYPVPCLEVQVSKKRYGRTDSPERPFRFLTKYWTYLSVLFCPIVGCLKSFSFDLQ